MIEITFEVNSGKALRELMKIDVDPLCLEKLEKIVLENFKVCLIESIPKYHDTMGCNGKSFDELFGKGVLE